jgi:hypothetical protein
MGSLAAARRTQSSFTTFLASTNPSDLSIAVFPPGNGGSLGGYSPALTRSIRRLAEVKRVQSWVEPIALPLRSNGAPDVEGLSSITVVGSVDGLSFDEDRPGVIEGRMPDPGRTNQFVTTPAGARFAHWHVGQVVPFGFYTSQQLGSPGFGTSKVAPAIRVDARLVGIVQFSNSVVQDQVDQYPTFALFTPALTRTLVARGMTFATYYAIQTTHGALGVATVEREFESIIPPGATVQDHVTSLVTAKADRAIRPESIALGVFGVAAALTALAVGGQAIARQLRDRATELEILRAIGAGPATVMSDELLGVIGAVLLGALVAFGVAVALSPIGPIGPVRPVYPDRGFAVDWVVLGSGWAVIIAVLATVSVVLAFRGLPDRAAGRHARSRPRRPMLANAAAGAGLGPPRRRRRTVRPRPGGRPQYRARAFRAVGNDPRRGGGGRHVHVR